MIVVDTNVIAGAYLPGPGAKVIESVMFKDSDWIAPYLWRSEFRNVLWQYLRHGKMTPANALRVAGMAEDRMFGQEFRTTTEQVLELANSSGCTTYDCEFVSVAQDLKLRLVTLDKKVLKQFPSIALSPEEFSAG